MYWILQWKCIAKSAESTIIKCYDHMMSFKPSKGGNILSFSKFQPELECWLTQLMSRNGFAQNLPLYQNAKREIDLPLLNISNLTCMQLCYWKQLYKGELRFILLRIQRLCVLLLILRHYYLILFKKKEKSTYRDLTSNHKASVNKDIFI